MNGWVKNSLKQRAKYNPERDNYNTLTNEFGDRIMLERGYAKAKHKATGKSETFLSEKSAKIWLNKFLISGRAKVWTRSTE